MANGLRPFNKHYACAGECGERLPQLGFRGIAIELGRKFSEAHVMRVGEHFQCLNQIWRKAAPQDAVCLKLHFCTVTLEMQMMRRSQPDAMVVA